MPFVKLLEDVDDIMSMNTNLKYILGLKGFFNIYFYLLSISDMMCRKGQDLPLVKYLANHLQYIQPVVTLWTCVLILDAIILNKLFLEFAFVITTFSLFLPKMYVFAVHCAIMSLFSVNYHWIKPFKTLHEKGRYVPNSLT